LSLESRGFIAFLEGAKILTPLLRELIIERGMALPNEVVGLDKLKVIVLMVLWTRRGNVDALILDELIPDGEKRQTH
jgi:Smg protein